MFPKISLPLSLCIAAALSTTGSGCKNDPSDPDAAPQVAPSAKPRVRPKHGRRFAHQLASGLELGVDELCTELGQYDCVEEAHLIVMGGVDAANLGVARPLEVAPVTAPIAYDRVAISGCFERVQRDFDDPDNAAVFGPLLAELPTTDADRRQVATDLYTRLLLRSPTEPELEVLADFFHDSIDPRETDATEADRLWAGLACFAVATSLESLFY